MKKVVDYTVIVAEKVEDLEAEVKEKLSEGWHPLAAPFQGGKDFSYLMQALVKYEN